jgi:hypothetical protein
MLMAGFILQFHMYDLRRLLIKEMLYLRITRMITKLTTPTADILNSLYPMHFIIDDAGALESLSATMALQFPEAQSMTDFLAPNSAEELILLIGKLRDEKNTSSKIDLFSIQQYAIWNSKIVRIEEQSSWLVCCEVELLQKNMKSAAEMSVEALNSIIQQSYANGLSDVQKSNIGSRKICPSKKQLIAYTHSRKPLKRSE